MNQPGQLRTANQIDAGRQPGRLATASIVDFYYWLSRIMMVMCLVEAEVAGNFQSIHRHIDVHGDRIIPRSHKYTDIWNRSSGMYGWMQFKWQISHNFSIINVSINNRIIEWINWCCMCNEGDEHGIPPTQGHLKMQLVCPQFCDFSVIKPVSIPSCHP